MADQVRVVLGELERFTAKMMVKLAFSITAELVEATPVDTGWARANWVPRRGAPQLVPVGSPQNVDRSAAAQGQASLARYSIFDGSIFISNNVPYIGRLNAGHSKQAPAGFIQRSIFRGIRGIATRAAPRQQGEAA